MSDLEKEIEPLRVIVEGESRRICRDCDNNLLLHCPLASHCIKQIMPSSLAQYKAAGLRKSIKQATDMYQVVCYVFHCLLGSTSIPT
jgi:hypothetical protein